MPIGDEDRRGITLAIAATLPRRLDQPLDLGRGQVLARPLVGVVTPCRRRSGRPAFDDFPIYAVWHVLAGSKVGAAFEDLATLDFLVTTLKWESLGRISPSHSAAPCERVSHTSQRRIVWRRDFWLPAHLT
jgi:hypothetical protein